MRGICIFCSSLWDMDWKFNYKGELIICRFAEVRMESTSQNEIQVLEPM